MTLLIPISLLTAIGVSLLFLFIYALGIYVIWVAIRFWIHERDIGILLMLSIPGTFLIMVPTTFLLMVFQVISFV
jgi:hypothetical protein